MRRASRSAFPRLQWLSARAGSSSMARRYSATASRSSPESRNALPRLFRALAAAASTCSSSARSSSARSRLSSASDHCPRSCSASPRLPCASASWGRSCTVRRSAGSGSLPCLMSAMPRIFHNIPASGCPRQTGPVLPVRPPPAAAVRPGRRARRSLAGEGRLVRAARRVPVRSSACTCARCRRGNSRFGRVSCLMGQSRWRSIASPSARSSGSRYGSKFLHCSSPSR